MPPPHHAAQKPTSKKISALNKLYAKQQQRRIPTGRLPDPMLNIAPHSYNSFVTHLKSSTRILALFGAGLSAASGIPTFRGAGGFWRDHDAITLATPEAFYKDPSLVWQFYSYRRHMSLKARPNRAHVALARLAEKKPEYMAITQNIDGGSRRIALGWCFQIEQELYRSFRTSKPSASKPPASPRFSLRHPLHRL